MQDKNYQFHEIESEASKYLEIKKARNETTYINYRTSLNYFIYYLKNYSDETSLGTHNKEKILDGFQSNLLSGFTYTDENRKSRIVKVNANAVNTHIRRVKTFLNKCLGLTVEITKLEVNKPKYKSLKIDEIQLLIAESSNYFSNPEIALRNKTLIKFLFNTAFRINEALSIKTEDIISEDDSYFVKIHEKGKAKGVQTTIAISEKTYNQLMDYINIKNVPSDYLFSSTRPSEDGKAKQFTRPNFNKAIIDLAKYVDSKHGTNIYNVVENNSSHVFRHSKATYLLNCKKEDVVTVKEILRHKSIDSTLIYLNPEEEAINKVRISNDI